MAWLSSLAEMGVLYECKHPSMCLLCRERMPPWFENWLTAPGMALRAGKVLLRSVGHHMFMFLAQT